MRTIARPVPSDDAFVEIDGVQYPLRIRTEEMMGRPVACTEIDGVLYPIEEEEFVSEGDWHLKTVIALINMVQALLRSRPQAGLFGNINTYWVKGNRRKAVAPDLIVLPLVPDPERKRDVLSLWEEASWPVFVLEALSRSTAKRDLDQKWKIYEQVLQVPEYFIYDPRAKPVEVWGYRLDGGAYDRIEPDEQGRVWSSQLEGWFGVGADGEAQVWDALGQPMLRYESILELTETVQRQAEAERQRAEAERERAETVRQRAEAAEARIRELEEHLRGQAGSAPGDGSISSEGGALPPD